MGEYTMGVIRLNMEDPENHQNGDGSFAKQRCCAPIVWMVAGSIIAFLFALSFGTALAFCKGSELCGWCVATKEQDAVGMSSDSTPEQQNCCDAGAPKARHGQSKAQPPAANEHSVQESGEAGFWYRLLFDGDWQSNTLLACLIIGFISLTIFIVGMTIHCRKRNENQEEF